MRIQIVIGFVALFISAEPSAADPLAQVLARLDALEMRNNELAKENAALKQRVSRLETGANTVAREDAATDERRPATPFATTSAVVPTKATSTQQPSQWPPPMTWTGAYAGVHGGGAWGDVSMSDSIPTVPFVVETFRAGFDGAGGLGGIQIGANKQFGTLVAGAELSLSGASISGSGDDCFSDALVGIPAECKARVNWLVTGLARLGYAHDRWLLSASAGWSIAGADYLQILDAGSLIAAGASETLNGFTYGTGLHYAVTPSVSLGFEYLHADLKADGAAFLSAIGATGKGSRDLDLDIARAQLNVKLGAD